MPNANSSLQDRTVDARPTKRLVAYVITKDIRLEDAILDLIDNSIDGAKRVSAGGSLAKSWVTVDFDKNRFHMADNCGGVPLAIARNYAFRFGRPDDYVPPLGAVAQIGNFGVGMKRALLKMGKSIKVSSATTTEFFELEIDVEAWLSTDEWTFTFTTSGQRATPAAKTGTTIEVKDLHPGVAERFGLKEFSTSLGLLVKDKQFEALSSGLSVRINNHSVESTLVGLLQSSKLKPIFRSDKLGAGADQVEVRLYAGLDVPDNDLAGWSVICNGRTVLRADRSSVTGWGNAEGGDKVASYHHQYARFRGYLFFDSMNADRLPWNTTKTGLDVEHPLYRKYRLEMIGAMREVFAFLNEFDRENEETGKTLQSAVEKAKPIPLSKVVLSTTFVRPERVPPKSSTEKLSWIKYQRPSAVVREVVAALDATDAANAGEITFDLYADHLAQKGKRGK